MAAGSGGAVDAASSVLHAGGNAVDAAVAAAFAATVCEPGLGSLAGGGFLTVRTAAGDEVLHDFDPPPVGESTTIEFVPPLAME